MHPATWLPVVVFCVLSVVLLFVVVFIVTAWLERKHIHVLVPRGHAPQLSAYAEAMNRGASEAGYQGHGPHGHANGGSYDLALYLWLSPEALTIAVVCGGKMVGVPYKRTILLSRLENGQYLETQDDFGEGDISGVSDVGVLMNAGFAELHRAHHQRLIESSCPAVPLSPLRLLDELAEVERQRAARLVARGLGRYRDPAHGVWSYTLRGAVALFCQSFLKQLGKAQAQSERMALPRPGG